VDHNSDDLARNYGFFASIFNTKTADIIFDADWPSEFITRVPGSSKMLVKIKIGLGSDTNVGSTWNFRFFSVFLDLRPTEGMEFVVC
jgi:hypothetical protein